ncbi:fibronectin type III domain-containing protein [Micromonospora sp. NBC_01699]|uniref:fibronectin type III domain-containing protein n=1 Tax=Micromonospora sp. NBC_01699 TaxID=2975984 RepID=UPI002E29648E|nr:fibronectin type III domain-containing protein [Micromonospora sp. NBC_01699]
MMDSSRPITRAGRGGGVRGNVGPRLLTGLLAAILLAAALPAVGPVTPAAAAVGDTERPTTPGPIEVVGYGTGSVQLTWAASTDNVGVVRYEVSQFYTDIAVLWRTRTNSITITGTLPSRTYRFSVRAVDGAGNSSSSPPLFKLTMPPGDNQPPTAPSALTATRITDTSVTVSWGGSSDNIGVALYEVLSITPSGDTVVASRSQHPPWPNNVLDVTRLTPGTTYTFAMRAADDAGNYSALSAPVTVTARPAGPDVSPPNIPGTPVASNLGPHGVTLTWIPATDDSGPPRYELVDRADPSGPVEVARTLLNQVTVGLVSGRTYVLVVHAVDAAGNRSPASGPLTLTAP